MMPANSRFRSEGQVVEAVVQLRIDGLVRLRSRLRIDDLCRSRISPRARTLDAGSDGHRAARQGRRGRHRRERSAFRLPRLLLELELEPQIPSLSEPARSSARSFPPRTPSFVKRGPTRSDRAYCARARSSSDRAPRKRERSRRRPPPAPCRRRGERLPDIEGGRFEGEGRLEAVDQARARRSSFRSCCRSASEARFLASPMSIHSASRGAKSCMSDRGAARAPFRRPFNGLVDRRRQAATLRQERGGQAVRSRPRKESRKSPALASGQSEPGATAGERACRIVDGRIMRASRSGLSST